MMRTFPLVMGRTAKARAGCSRRWEAYAGTVRQVQRVVVLAVLSLVAAAPAAASNVQAPFALPAVDLSLDEVVLDAPEVAVAPDGTTTVVWSRRADGPEQPAFAVMASTRPPRGAFAAPVQLSVAGETAAGPRVAVAPDGTTTVAWSREVGNNTGIVRAATRVPDGAFGAPVDVSAVGYVGQPSLAVGADGTTTVAWGPSRVEASTRPPDGTFGPPVQLSPSDGFSPDVTVAPDGTATVVWNQYTDIDTFAQVVRASTQPPGGAFGAPVDLSEAGQTVLGGPRVAVAADGATTAIWDGYNGTVSSVHANTRLPGGAFGAPVTLDADSGTVIPYADVAVAPDGTTTVVWVDENSAAPSAGQGIIRASIRAPGDAFGAPVDLSDPAQWATLPQVAAAPDGTTAAVWERFDGEAVRVQESTRSPDGTFSSPVTLSVAGRPATWPQVAVAPQGAVTVVWLLEGVAQATYTIDGPPVLRAAPTIKGRSAVGGTLTCDGGAWVAAASVTTDWLRGATPVGAGPSHTIGPEDQGTTLSCRGTASNLFGSVEALSAPLQVPSPAPLPGVLPRPRPPVARSRPKLTGAPRLGRTLRCAPATFTGATRQSISWLRASRPIKGAHRRTYRITRRDLGRIISCRTTATGPGGTTTSASQGTRARR